MPNPGTFRGSRLTFLDAQADIYANGVRNNQLADTVADIQRRYFKRYPMTLEHNVEPTQEWLDSVDDTAPDPEITAPDLETMSNEAYSEALEKFNSLQADTKARKDSIKRRLAYVYSKNCGKDTSLDSKGKKGTSDPLTALKAKLAGVELKAPRMRTAYNVWGPQNRAIVDPIYNQRVQEGNIPAKEQLALRSAVYKELFAELPEEEQKKWADIAKRDHDRALEDLRTQEWRATSAVRSNADYQKVISALPAIMEPMLDLLCEYTGWKFSLQGGGPEPADGGRLNMIFMHSGVAPGSVSVDFGCAERDTFKKLLMPAFGRYMKKCYNKEACMARALPANHGTATLADVRLEEGADVALYRVEHDKTTTKPAPKKRLFEAELELLNRGKSKAKPPTGTPSPRVRFGPPIGKPKDRMLPTKDNPASLLPGSFKVFKSSPLAQTVVTAPEVAPESSSTSLPGAESASKPTGAAPIDVPVANRDLTARYLHVDTQSHEQTSTVADVNSQLSFEPPTAVVGSTRPVDGSVEIPATGTADAIQEPEPSATVTPSLHALTVPPGAIATSPGSDSAPSLPPSPVPSRPTSPVHLHASSPPQTPSSCPTSCVPSRPISPLQIGAQDLSPAPSLLPVLSHLTSTVPSRPTSPLEDPEQAISPAPSPLPSLVPSRPTSPLENSDQAFSPAPSPLPSPVPSSPTSPLEDSDQALSSAPSPLPFPVPSRPASPLQVGAQAHTPAWSPSLSPGPSRPTLPLHPTARTPPSVPPHHISLVVLQAGTAALSCTTSPVPPYTASESPLRNTARTSLPIPSCSAPPLQPSAQTSSSAPVSPGLPLPPHTASTSPVCSPSPVSDAIPHPPSTIASYPTLSAPLCPTSPPPQHPTPLPLPSPLERTSPTSSHPTLTVQSHPKAVLSATSAHPPPALPGPWVSHAPIEGAAAVLQPSSFSATPPGAATVPTIDDFEVAQGHSVETAPISPRSSKKRSGSKPTSAQPSKKQRTGAEIARAFAVPAAANSPRWVSNAVDFLASEDLGPAWRRVVELWVTLEAGYGFDEQGDKLLARGRPPVVAEWIKRARSPRYQPTIGSLAAFENTYTLWWRSAQPDWRLADGSSSLKQADGDWDVIRCSGVNGLLSALAALFFWGVALGSSCTANAAWTAAVADATYVLENIA